MKMLALALFLTSVVQPLVSQGRHLWVGLSGNRVMLDVALLSVGVNSVSVAIDGRVTEVQLDEIEEVRVIHGGVIVRGAVAGASVGVAVGGLIGFLGAPREDRNWRAGTTALAAGVLGGIIGSVLESIPEKNEIIRLQGQTLNVKREVFEEILRLPME